MKKTILVGATLAFVGLAIAPVIAQTQSTATKTTSSGYMQSSTVIGAKIKNDRGEDIGEIKDFVLDRETGCLAYVVLSTGTGIGSRITGTSKTVAAPWSVFSASSDPRVYTTRVERERIYSAPVWESSRYDEYSRPEYMTNVYRYYGVQPTFGVGINVGGSGARTSTSTTTGVGASTGATASPAPTATASPTATGTATATASPTATATVAASPTATVAASPAAKAAASPTPASKASPAATAAASKSTPASGGVDKDAPAASPGMSPSKATKSSKTGASPSSKASPSGSDTAASPEPTEP